MSNKYWISICGSVLLADIETIVYSKSVVPIVVAMHGLNVQGVVAIVYVFFSIFIWIYICYASRVTITLCIFGVSWFKICQIQSAKSISNTSPYIFLDHELFKSIASGLFLSFVFRQHTSLKIVTAHTFSNETDDTFFLSFFHFCSSLAPYSIDIFWKLK